jgi:uncharacterized protein YbaP (TraB family)
MSREQEEAFLRFTLHELDTVIPLVDGLIASWRAGEVDEVAALLAEGYDDFPELFARMVTDRNRRWFPELIRTLEGDRPAFVVVGALHMVGEDGLIAMFRKRGYAVEQL